MLKKAICTICAATFVFCLIPVVSFAAVERYEVLAIGDEDEWVLELQQTLNDLGYMTVSPTGYFGTNTQSAVAKFQQDNQLSVDGKAGPETRRVLLAEEYSDIPSSRSTDDSLTGKEASASLSVSPDTADSEGDATDTEDQSEIPPQEQSAKTLTPGDKGEAIAQMQARLKELEYYEYSSITGYFGPVTEEAIGKFQRTHGLSVDGSMNETSLALLYSDQAKSYMMYPGDRSQDIMKMQDKLKELGYFNTDSTGYYGDVTLNAVRQFQTKNGLTVDGKAGSNTRALLYSDDAKPAQNDASDTSSTDADNDGDTSAPSPTPTPTPTPIVTSGSTGAAKVIEVANSQSKKPYSYGSSGPNSFDCSGFVYYVLKNSGIATSRLSSASYATVSNWDTISDINSLSAGDLVFFKSDNSSTISHMGIYVGGGSFIHAAPSSGGVDISSMSSGYYLRNFVLAKRIF